MERRRFRRRPRPKLREPSGTETLFDERIRNGVRKTLPMHRRRRTRCLGWIAHKTTFEQHRRVAVEPQDEEIRALHPAPDGSRQLVDPIEHTAGDITRYVRLEIDLRAADSASFGVIEVDADEDRV